MLCLTAALAGCGAPVGWIVPYEVVVELRADHTPPFDRDAFDRAVRERFDTQLTPGPWLEEQWRSLDGDKLLHDARDGDLILVKNYQAQSLSSTIGLASPTWFDHSGVLEFTPAGPLVYESWPVVRIFAFTRDFASRFVGHTQATPLAEYLARYHHALVVRPPGDGARRLERARKLAAERIPFDCYHDPKRPELSCTEFLSQVGEFELTPIPTSPLPAIAHLRGVLGWYVQSFITPDGVLALPGVQVICELGRHRSLAEVRALQAMWREIHHMSQREGSIPGDWLTYSRLHLFGWHPRVRALLEWSVALARLRPDVDPESRARVLMELALSPGPKDLAGAQAASAKL